MQPPLTMLPPLTMIWGTGLYCCLHTSAAAIYYYYRYITVITATATYSYCYHATCYCRPWAASALFSTVVRLGRSAAMPCRSCGTPCLAVYEWWRTMRQRWWSM